MGRVLGENGGGEDWMREVGRERERGRGDGVMRRQKWKGEEWEGRED